MRCAAISLGVLTMRRTLILLLVLLVSLPVAAEEVRVFAAASLTDVLKDIAKDYERGSGDRIVFNFGSSSMLARQIQEDAPADLFLSADELKMDALQKRGLIDRKTRRSVLSNTLVVVVPADRGMTITSVKELADDRVISVAIAEPTVVPAGIYAREYLLKIGVWGRVARKAIPMDNVRAALAAVESGNADCGIVYRTDALISKHVRVAVEVPRNEGPDISYPFAVTTNAQSPAAARRFLAYLTSKPALDVFRRYGFLIVAHE
jgi:molybdate transport system substrate-binding protein